MAWARRVAAAGSRTAPARSAVRVALGAGACGRGGDGVHLAAHVPLLGCGHQRPRPDHQEDDEHGGHRHHRPPIAPASPRRGRGGHDPSASDDVDLFDASAGEGPRAGEAGDHDVGERHGAGDVDGDDAAGSDVSADGDAEVLAGHTAIGEHVTGHLGRGGGRRAGVVAGRGGTGRGTGGGIDVAAGTDDPHRADDEEADQEQSGDGHPGFDGSRTTVTLAPSGGGHGLAPWGSNRSTLADPVAVTVIVPKNGSSDTTSPVAVTVTVSPSDAARRLVGVEQGSAGLADQQLGQRRPLRRVRSFPGGGGGTVVGGTGEDLAGVVGEPVLDDEQHGQQHDGHDDDGGGHLPPVAGQAAVQGDGTLLALAAIFEAITPPAAMAAITRITINAVVAVISPRSS